MYRADVAVEIICREIIGESFIEAFEGRLFGFVGRHLSGGFTSPAGLQ
jgi:hypothetical protein